MKEAVFALKNYSFVRAALNLEEIPVECSFALKFEPSGIYDKNTGTYLLSLVFKAIYGDNVEAVNVKVQAVFQFKEALLFEDIPPFFFSNSIAIIFPYVRSFVSTITLQANVAPIILPTLNVSVLQDELRIHTAVK